MRMLGRLLLAGAAGLPLVPASAAATPPIPGVHLRDVTSRLTAQGFTCSGGQRLENAVLGWTCERSTRTTKDAVIVLGSSGAAIFRVDAQVFATSGAVDPPARAFLGDLAALRYTGARPAAARAWVRRYTGTARHRAFGRATYRLQTVRNSRFLVISGRHG